MTSTRLLLLPAQVDYRPLSSRASSATLFATKRPYNYIDGAADATDMIIAEGLLRGDKPQIAERQNSSTQSTSTQQHSILDNNDLPAVHQEPSKDPLSRRGITSNTWTSSSGDRTEEDGNDNRTLFVQEYNRLAKKHGIQPIAPDEFVVVNVDKVTLSAKQGSWIMRKLLRRTSSVHITSHKTEKHVRHKRSVSELSLRMKAKKDTLKDKRLEELVRICGSSALYLPAEYAAGTLSVPTCFRATAQYLVQHAAESRGIFRIPGSHSTINALYNHYASDTDDGDFINGTVRCPTLPEHINCNVHDVASAFKKFLAGLPGGILGKVWVFDSLLSIYSQLDATAEFTRTKQSKVRARLIALAIACISQRYQRELICAVIGLLSMIGRAAETAPREDDQGRPLPTSDLMGYGALGIVFGPLLIGDLLDNCDLRPSGPHGPLTFIHRSPPKPLKSKHKRTKTDDSNSLIQGTDRIRVINSITEMLITHWRDVVRHMRNLGALKSGREHHDLAEGSGRLPLRLSASETFAVRRPPEWNIEKMSSEQVDRRRSPTPLSRYKKAGSSLAQHDQGDFHLEDILSVRKGRPRPRPKISQTLSVAKSMSILAPTIEENGAGDTEQHSSELDEEGKMQDSAHLIHVIDLTPTAQTFHTARSESFSKVKRGEIRLVNPNEISQGVGKGPVNAASKDEVVTQKLNGLSEKSKYPPKPGSDTPALRNMAEETTSNDEIASTRQETRQNKTFESSRFYKQESRHSDMAKSDMLTSPRNFELVQSQAKASLKVPIGIVSSRLRRIAASDPGSGPPSGFRIHMKSSNITPAQQKQKPHAEEISSKTFNNRKGDPLARVSQEEDLASLALLAKAINHEDETIILNSSPRIDPTGRSITPVGLVKTQVRSITSKSRLSEYRSGDAIQDIINDRSPRSPRRQQIEKINTSPSTSVYRISVTPKRSATKSNMSGRSVKTLAAKFNDPELNSIIPSSPGRTPELRRAYDSRLDSTVISTYTINNSPVSKSQKPNVSDRSLQAVSNASPARRYTSPLSIKAKNMTTSLLPKPLFASSIQQGESRSPRYDSTHQVASNLHLSGDGHVSFPTSGTVRRRRDPGTSILYSQIQHLQRQLEIKNDEIELLRQQLRIRNSLNDSKELSG